MIIALITAFMTYRLFGTWGIFHWTAVLSSITLLGGLFPIYLKVPKKNYLSIHFGFMYWSVMGVYAAFVSETLVRLPKVVVNSGVPNSLFYNMTGIGTGIVISFAVYFFIKNKAKWEKEFKAYEK
jgi:hypothetical protein